MPRAQMTSHPAWLPGEQRQHDRLSANVTIDIDEPSRSQPATLVDLSSAGCRVRVVERMSLGAFVTVRLNDTVDAKGWVAWSRGLDAGIDFAAPLAETTVGDIAGTAK